jgi:hypothetical protein
MRCHFGKEFEQKTRHNCTKKNRNTLAGGGEWATWSHRSTALLLLHTNDYLDILIWPIEQGPRFKKRECPLENNGQGTLLVPVEFLVSLDAVVREFTKRLAIRAMLRHTRTSGTNIKNCQKNNSKEPFSFINDRYCDVERSFPSWPTNFSKRRSKWPNTIDNNAHTQCEWREPARKIRCCRTR